MAGHYFETVENNITGKPVAGATVLVYNAGANKIGDAITAGTLATIFSDDGVTQMDQGESPITTDSRGFFEFWTNETSVCYEISYGGSARFAVTDVEIVGGNISGDVTALATRVSALEAFDNTLGTMAVQDADSVAITGGAIAGIMDLAVADGGTGASSAPAARANLSAAALSQTGEGVAIGIGTVEDGDYIVALKMPHAGTITETTTKSASGTCTATFKVNSTALGGAVNSVSSSETSQAHSGTNTFAAGDDIVLTVSSNSTCLKLAAMVKYTRTFD